MADEKCGKCGSPLEYMDRIVTLSISEGGGTESRREAMPCEACADMRKKAAEKEMSIRQFRGRRLDSRIPQEVWELGMDAESWKRHRLVIDWGNQVAVQHTRAWVKAERAGLLLTGTQGLGKSLIAMCAGMDCLRDGQQVLYLSERELIDSYQSRRRDEDNLAIRARSAEVLIIDDMGRHVMDRGTAYLKEVYYDLFDSRLPVFADPLKTLVTSQMVPEALTAWCNDEAMASRLMAILGGNFLLLSGSDRRKPRWTIGAAKGGA